MAEPYYADDLVQLYHGDCLEIAEWLTADVLLTDPPYGFDHSSNWVGKFQGVAIANDSDLTARDAVLTSWGDRPAIVYCEIAARRLSQDCLFYGDGDAS